MTIGGGGAAGRARGRQLSSLSSLGRRWRREALVLVGRGARPEARPPALQGGDDGDKGVSTLCLCRFVDHQR